MSDALEVLGWSADFEAQRVALADPGLRVGRVAIPFGEIYSLLGADGAMDAPLGGRMVHQEERPVVGDWVGVSAEGRIEHLFERRTRFARQAPGKRAVIQVIAANIDRILVVTTVGRDFNLRRLERYLAAVWDSGATPAVVVNKADTDPETARFRDRAEAVAPGVPVLVTSAHTGEGLDAIRAMVHRGTTVAFVGSSGVGKSTIINALLGQTVQATGEVRTADEKGRHTTTHRELIPLGDGVLLDTPGMRELQIWVGESGLEGAFPDIEELAADCRFRDCQHGDEPGCAVQGVVAPDRLASWKKLLAEMTYQQSRADPAQASERRARLRRINLAIRRHPKYRDQ